MSKRFGGSVVHLIHAHMVQVYDIAYGNKYRTVLSFATASTFLVPVTNDP
jgi:galactokinase